MQVHRLRFDNSEMASAVFVEMRERERKKPAEAYRASTGAEAPSDPSQLPAAEIAMTHARLLTGADPRAAPGFPLGAVVYYEVRLHPQPQPHPHPHPPHPHPNPNPNVVCHEVRLRAPGHEGHIVPLDEQVDRCSFNSSPRVDLTLTTRRST